MNMPKVHALTSVLFKVASDMNATDDTEQISVFKDFSQDIIWRLSEEIATPTAGAVEVASQNSSTKLSSIDIDLSSRFKDGQMVHTKDGNGIVNGHVDGKVLVEILNGTMSYEPDEITPF